MQYKIKIIVLFTTVFFLWNDLHGQQVERLQADNCPEEKILMHLSQESAFSGEMLWFKLYCTSPLFPGDELSNLAFIELVSNENSSVLREKILLKHGEGTGELEIPGNVPTGIYYILAYTNWMKNFGENYFFRKEIVIINPSQPLNFKSDSLSTGITEELTNVPGVYDKRLEIVPEKTKYSTREQVIMKIETGNLPGDTITGSFSVSVCRKEPRMIFNTKENKEKGLIKAPESIDYLPDYRGILLSGKLMDLSGNPVPDAFVTASEPGPGTNIKSYVTDNLGNFNFLLKPNEGEQEMVITFPSEDMKISLKEPFWNGFRNPPENIIPVLNREVVSYLKEKYACSQLQNRFKRQYSVKTTPVENAPDTNLFYFEPQLLIRLEDYVKLDSLREYFYELVSTVSFTQRKDKIDISVIDPLTMIYIKDKPGIFLDGVLYDNFSAIAKIPVEEIDRLAIISQLYYYKDFSFGGIIDIHTKKSDFNSVKPLKDMTRFIYPLANIPEWKFLHPDYSIDPSDRTPDLRYLLHWEPVVKTDKSGEASIRFYTGDVKGTFVIKVVGLSGNGEILQTESEINVY
jgi:hypothetical protein